MKSKFFNMAVFLVVLFGLVALNSCSGTDAEDTTSTSGGTTNTDTTTGTTTDTGATTGGTTGGGSTTTFTSSATSTGDSPFCGSYVIDTDFMYQVWKEATDANPITTNGDGSITLTVTSGKWTGGGLAVSTGSTTNTLDLSKVAKIKFTIKGTLPATSLEIFTQVGGTSINEKTFNNYGTITTTAQTVEIPLTTAAQAKSNNAFTFVLKDGAGYVTISDIDWVDASGKSVDITP